MYDLKEIKKTSVLFSKAYTSFSKYIPDWVETQATIQKGVNAIFSKSLEVDLPEYYWTDQASLFADAQILCEPKTIKKIRREFEPFIDNEARKGLAFWARNPAFWCYYAVREDIGDDFFVIEDLVTGDTHLLHSHEITFLLTDELSKDKNYLSLLLPNGSCLQPLGFPKFFSLPASDIQFFFSLFSPRLELGAAINRNFTRLIELEFISTMPLVMDGDVQLEMIWQPFKLKEFSILELGGAWKSLEFGKQQLFIFIQEEPENVNLPDSQQLTSGPKTLTVSLMRDNKSGEMGLFTSTSSSFTAFATLLTDTYPQLALPEKPLVSISLGLGLFLTEDEYPVPWKKFTFLMQTMDEYISNKMVMHDSHPVIIEESLAMLSSLNSPDGHEKGMTVYSVDEKDKPFELFDWPKPPKQMLDLFTTPLTESVVFEVMDDSNSRDLFNTLTNGSYKEVFEQDGLAAFVTSLFDDAFPPDVSMLIMHAFIWILYHKGREWIPARSYAIEMLKLFPTSITKAYPDSEDFIQEVNTFTRRILTTRGICSLAKRPTSEEVTSGTFTIKGTDAFFSLIRPGEYQID